MTVRDAPAPHGARLRAVDDSLAAAWQDLAAGRLRLEQLHACAPHAAALYWLGFDAGHAAQVERVQQAQHDADRLYVLAHNPEEQARIVEARMSRALEAVPPHVVEHSREYFAHALAAALESGAAA